MDKRIVIIGLLLVACAGVTVIANFSQQVNLPSQLQVNSTTQNITISHDSFSATKLQIQSSFVVTGVEMSSAANFYLFNTSAFNDWNASVSSAANTANVNGLSAATALENAGAYIIYQNTTFAQAPILLNYTVKPVYTRQNLTLSPGVYYMVIDNTKGSASSANTVYAKVINVAPLSNATLTGGGFATLYSSFSTQLSYGTAFLFFLVCGVVTIFYGFFRQSPEERRSSTEKIEEKRAPAKKEPTYFMGKKVSKEYKERAVDELYRRAGVKDLGRSHDHEARKKAKKKA